MITEEEIKTRLAEFNAKLDSLTRQWWQHSNESQGLRGIGYTEERTENEQIIRQIEEEGNCIAEQVKLLKWVLGQVHGHDLVPAYMRGWIRTAEKPEYLLKELKKHLDIMLDDNQQPLHKEAGQYSALITNRLEELKSKALYGRTAPSWVRDITAEETGEADYIQQLKKLTDAELEREIEARKVDWMRNEQHEKYPHQYENMHWHATNEKGRRWLARHTKNNAAPQI